MIATLILATITHLDFTAPTDSTGWPTLPVRAAESYLLLQKDRYGAFQFRAVYSESSVTSPKPIPKAPGSTERIWFSLSEDGEPRLYRVFSRDGSGNWSPASNPLILAGGALADTGYVDLSTYGGVRDSWSHQVSPGKWVVQFTRGMEDSAFSVHPRWWAKIGVDRPVLSWRDFQRAFAPISCRVWPVWYEGGREWACP